MQIIVRLRAASLAALALCVVAPPAGAAAPDRTAPPGVCWDYTVLKSVPSNEIPDHEIAAFCLPLRTGVVYHLRTGQWHQATEQFQKAEQAATAITDDDRRAMALDEARAAQALAAEHDDWQYAAALLAPARSLYKTRDILALTRAYFHVRHGLFAEAQRDFEQARKDLPNHWGPETEAALRAAKAGIAAETSSAVRLPSYLEGINALGIIKAHTIHMPAGQSYQVSFDLGDHTPVTGSDGTLQAMARHIEAYEQRAPGTLRWIMVGHTDEACWQGQQATCRSDNRALSLKRAEAVQKRLADLLQNMNVDGTEFRVEGRGMDAPLHSRGINVADARNRRVHLMPEPRTPAKSQATAQCPWEVKRIDHQAGADISGGGARHMTVDLAPNSTTRVPGKAVFTIRYVPSLAPSAMRHFHIVSENQAGHIADLAARAGLSDTALSTLEARGGTLLDNDMVFATDDGATEETIHLYVSDTPLPLLDKLRGTPVASPARSVTAGPRTAVRMDDTRLTVATLAAYGATKDWGPRPSVLPGIPDVIFALSQPAAASHAAHPVPEVAIPLPVVTTPHLKSTCAFTFALN